MADETLDDEYLGAAGEEDLYPALAALSPDIRSDALMYDNPEVLVESTCRRSASFTEFVRCSHVYASTALYACDSRPPKAWPQL